MRAKKDAKRLIHNNEEETLHFKVSGIKQDAIWPHIFMHNLLASCLKYTDEIKGKSVLICTSVNPEQQMK